MEVRDRARLNVLVVEPHRTVAQALTKLVGVLGHAEVTASVSDTVAAVNVVRKSCPDVALLDLDLSPDCSLVTALHSLCPDLRIIVLGDQSKHGPNQVLKAMSSGAVGAIYKESSVDELARALRSGPGERTVPAEATDLLLDSYIDVMADKRNRELAMIEALASAVEVRDLCTGRHLQRVTALAQECLEKVEPELARNDEVGYGFMLHDVGKIGIPDAVLNKPGPLDRSEWDVMRRHPQMGVEIVQPVGLSGAATEIIMCHHEHWNGSGYPNGLVGSEIPLTARAFAVADAYDAMTSDRPYRHAMSPAEALDLIRGHAGRSFDPEMVEVITAVAGSESHN